MIVLTWLLVMLTWHACGDVVVTWYTCGDVAAFGDVACVW
jgi:hypothetical protein